MSDFLNIGKTIAHGIESAVQQVEHGKALQGLPALGNKQLIISRKNSEGDHQFIARLMFTHDLKAPPPQSMGRMMLNLTQMSTDLQSNSIQIAQGMISDHKNRITRNAKKQEQKMEEMHRAMEAQEAKRKRAKKWGIFASIVGAIVSVATLGSGSALAIGLTAGSMLVGAATSAVMHSKGFQKLAEKDPAAAKGIMFGLMALQIGLAIMGARAAQGAKAASEVGEAASTTSKLSKVEMTVTESGDAMSDATKAGSTMSETAGSGDEMAEGVATIAAKTGAQMAKETTSVSRAERLAEGIRDMTRYISRMASRTGREAKVAEEAEEISEVLKGGKKVADGTSGMDKLSNRVGAAVSGAQMVAQTGQFVTTVDATLADAKVQTVQADLDDITRHINWDRDHMNDLIQDMKDMVGSLEQSIEAAADATWKLDKSAMKITSRLGANPRGSV